MNVYIYDSFLNQKKYDQTLAQIETRLTDLGLNGKIARLGIMKNINDIVDYELKRGAKTIIAVGNDQTVNRVINALADSQVPLGIIPIGEKNNDIATALGIGQNEAACEILSARRITKIDLGLANNFYFIGRAAIINQGTTLAISQTYSIEIVEKGKIEIINLLPANLSLPAKIKINPQDGILELVIKTSSRKKIFTEKLGHSVFPIKKITVRNKEYPLILDGAREIMPPVEISLLKQKLRVIVGKSRNF